MTPTQVLPRLLTVTEAAEALNVKPRKLQDHWRRWGIPATKVGRELRFAEPDLLDYLESRRVA
jgi:excisionase family DNA binding protein